MPWLIERPARLVAAGTPPKTIEEYVGRLNSGHEEVSVARMVSPEGWSEAGQRPEFLEITVVLRGPPAPDAQRVAGLPAALAAGRSAAAVAEAGAPSAVPAGLTVITGHGHVRTTRSAVLPSSACLRPV